MLTNKSQRAVGAWSLGLLINIVVLNLWIEYSNSVIIDSFTISVFAAVVMRLLISGTLRIEHGVSGLFERLGPGKIVTALRLLTAWVILFLSKFIILEVIDVVFREHVEIKGLLVFIAVVATLVISDKIVIGYYGHLGEQPKGEPGLD